MYTAECRLQTFKNAKCKMQRCTIPFRSSVCSTSVAATPDPSQTLLPASACPEPQPVLQGPRRGWEAAGEVHRSSMVLQKFGLAGGWAWLGLAPVPSRARASCNAGLLDFRRVAGTPSTGELEPHATGTGVARFILRAANLHEKSSMYTTNVAWNSAWHWRFRSGPATPLGSTVLRNWKAQTRVCLFCRFVRRARTAPVETAASFVPWCNTDQWRNIGQSSILKETDRALWNFRDNLQLLLELGSNFEKHHRTGVGGGSSS